MGAESAESVGENAPLIAGHDFKWRNEAIEVKHGAASIAAEQRTALVAHDALLFVVVVAKRRIREVELWFGCLGIMQVEQ
jgi:hypothetical protein